MGTTIPLVDMTSCQFGVHPQRFHKKPPRPGTDEPEPVGFGAVFPQDPAVLERMAPAMRREAALLALEAKRPRPAGSLPVDSIVPLHRVETDEPLAGGAREDAVGAEAMAAFAQEHLEEAPDAILTIAALRTAVAGWATRAGIVAPTPTAIGSFLNARWEQFRSRRAGAGTNWRGVRLKAG